MHQDQWGCLSNSGYDIHLENNKNDTAISKDAFVVAHSGFTVLEAIFKTQYLLDWQTMKLMQ